LSNRDKPIGFWLYPWHSHHWIKYPTFQIPTFTIHPQAPPVFCPEGSPFASSSMSP
jgi:hypothetical protein